MNVPEGVNTEAENLLSRIPIRDLTFLDEFFEIFKIFGDLTFFWKFWKFLENDVPGAPRGRPFLENGRSKIQKNGVKYVFPEETSHFTGILRAFTSF